EDVGAALSTSTQLRFERGQAPGGTPWPPSLRARLEGGQTLVKSGRLRDSITYEAGPAAVRVGTNTLYAATHQQGATIAAKAGGKLRFRLPGGLGWRSVA